VNQSWQPEEMVSVPVTYNTEDRLIPVRQRIIWRCAPFATVKEMASPSRFINMEGRLLATVGIEPLRTEKEYLQHSEVVDS